MNVDATEIESATRSPLSPLTSGRLLPNGKEAPVPPDEADQEPGVPSWGERLKRRLTA